MSIFHGGYDAIDIRSEANLEGDEPGSAGQPSNGSAMHVGFRNVFQTPTLDQRFRGTKLVSEEGAAATQLLLLKLAKQIQSNLLQDNDEADWQNKAIPAGYTYFLQFVLHDLIHTASALPTAQGVRKRQINMRRTHLELEALYGGGPALNPVLYEAPLDGTGARQKLKVGRIQVKDVPENKCPFSDIPRIGNLRNSGPTDKGLFDVLIADPRNDDNALLAQLTYLFHELHNMVVDRLPASSDSGSLSEQKGLSRFSRARNVVVTVYRNLITEDLLPRLLHKSVLSRYAGQRDEFLDASDFEVPLEFAHAVCRIGHAMVRPNYRIQPGEEHQHGLKDVLRTTSSRRPWRMPISNTWVLDWSLFYELGNEDMNFSAKIQPHIAPALATNTIVASPVDGDSLSSGGLYFRDFMRGAAAGLWSVDSLCQHLLTTELADPVRSSRLLTDRQYRIDEIKKWLDRCPVQLLSDEEEKEICEDPPLLFFVLFEAAHEHDGSQLGILGSIVAAEALFNALDQSPLQIGQIETGLGEQIEADCKHVFASGAPTRMPDLVKSVMDHVSTNSAAAGGA